MNKYLSLAAAAVLMLSSCNESDLPSGEGTVALQTTLSSDVKVVSRSAESDLAETCIVWISSDKGLVRQYQGLSQIPAEIKLMSGNYVAEAWAGDSVAASFDTRCFYGRQAFSVSAGRTEPVALTCKIANTLASVRYADGIESLLSNISMTIGHSGASLVFDGRDDRKGYYMFPTAERKLNYELRGTQINGQELVVKGTIDNAERATEYVINVNYTSKPGSLSGAYFTITVDKQEVEVASEIKVIPAPAISGFGFNIQEPVSAVPGSVGQRIVFVSSAARITSMTMESPLLGHLGGESYELVGMSGETRNALIQGGITVEYRYDEALDNTLMRLVFDENFTATIPSGESAITLTATDADGRQTLSALSFYLTEGGIVAPPRPQLPNAGFEDWYTNGKIQAVGNADAPFWDSGNTASAPMTGINMTQPDSDIKHSGNYSARLRSQFAGVFGMGAFAAGNVFVGKFIGTEGTNGVLGFGRPFAGSPKALKLWVKYTPQPANSKGAGDLLPEGAMDRGSIFIALLDDSKMSFNEEQWPVIVRTKPANRQLFDKDGANVLAYGERIFDSATDGDGMVEITIPIDYRRTDIVPSNIIVCASASASGDFFQGGEGSTMWIDDLELVY